MKSILRITTVFLFILLLNPVFAQNNRLKVAGSIQTDTILASKIIKPGGNSGQILMADGSVVTTGTGISISNGQISSTGGTANFTGNNTQFLMGDGSTVNTGNNLQVMAFDANRRPTYYNINTTAIGESVPEVATTSYVDFKLQENYGEYTNAIVSEATSTQLGRIKLTGDLGGTGNSPTVPGLALKFNLSDTADFANRFVRLRNAQTIAGNKTFTGTTNFTGNITLNGVAGTTGQVLSINASGNPAWVNLATSGGGGGITSLTSPLNITNGALSIPQASSTMNGFLSSGDWNRFNNKFNAADTTRLLNSRAKIFVPKIGGTDVSLVSGTSTDTLQIPLAGTNVAGGLLSNTTQNIAGNKTFFDNVAYRYQSAISFRDFNNTVDEWVFTRISGDPNLPGNTNPKSTLELRYQPFNTFIGTPALLYIEPNGDFYTSGRLSAAGGFNSFGKAFYTNEGLKSGTTNESTTFNQVLNGTSAGAIIEGGRLVTSGTINSRSTITGANLSTGGAISGASLSTSGTISAGTNLTVGGTLTATGNISSSGTVTGTQFIRPGGTANQFLMADGSVRNSLISEGFIGSPENNKRGIAIGANTPSAVLHVDVSNYDESSNYNGAMITSTNKDTYLKINSNNSPASAALRNSALIISRNDLGAWFFGLTSVNNNLNIQSISQSAAFVGINNSAPAYLLDVNGDIAATKKVFSFGVQLASDARLKRNIKPITNAIELIKKFRAVGYDKRENIKSETYAEHEYGFIAQEVQKVLPELVKVGNDKDKILSVNYNSLIPILTKGMQEQENKIREQEQLIQSLLKRIEKLEKK